MSIDPLISSRFEEGFARSPIVLVDVGARGGIPKRWKRIREHLRVIGFEADVEEADSLSGGTADTYHVVLGTALGSEPGVRPFFTTREPRCSSFLSPNHRFLSRFPGCSRLEVESVAEMRTDTLDNQLSAHELDADFLKLDTQGLEFEILEGAGTLLDGALFGMEIEVWFAPVYEGQPFFSDIDQLARDSGFQLFDLVGSYWKRELGGDTAGDKGQIVWGDALYLRGSEVFAGLVADIADPDVRRSKALNAIVVCLLYGYVDYALEILDATGGFLSPDDRADAYETLRAAGRSGRLPGRDGRLRRDSLGNDLWTPSRTAVLRRSLARWLRRMRRQVRD